MYNNISLNRIFEKLDSLFSKKDFISAEDLLTKWIESNEINSSEKLSLINEQIGLYRKLSARDKCLRAINNAEIFMADMEDKENDLYATTLLNIATGYKAFNFPEKAVALYEKAKIIYKKILDENNPKLGGLYNNMGLALSELKQYKEAEQCYQKAISIMSKNQGCEGETAISYLNLADLYYAKDGIEKSDSIINSFIKKAENLLFSSLPENANTAYIFEKCAPVFGFYGYFLIEKDLIKKARLINERA